VHTRRRVQRHERKAFPFHHPLRDLNHHPAHGHRGSAESGPECSSQMPTTASYPHCHI
jgi:hypothetical protein